MASLVAAEVFITNILFRDPAGLVQLLGVALIVVSASNFVASLLESLRQVRTVTIIRFISGAMFAIIGTGMLLLWNAPRARTASKSQRSVTLARGYNAYGSRF